MNVSYHFRQLPSTDNIFSGGWNIVIPPTDKYTDSIHILPLPLAPIFIGTDIWNWTAKKTTVYLSPSWHYYKFNSTTWWYEQLEEICTENDILMFFKPVNTATTWDNQPTNLKNWIFKTNQEALKRLTRHSSSANIPLLSFTTSSIDVLNISQNIINNDLVWVWIKVPWDPAVKNVRLGGGVNVMSCAEARSAIQRNWVMEYIQFHFDSNTAHHRKKVKITKDLGISFYSDLSLKEDIDLIMELSTRVLHTQLSA